MVGKEASLLTQVMIDLTGGAILCVLSSCQLWSYTCCKPQQSIGSEFLWAESLGLTLRSLLPFKTFIKLLKFCKVFFSLSSTSLLSGVVIICL